jgi:hypothetical protein
VLTIVIETEREGGDNDTGAERLPSTAASCSTPICALAARRSVRIALRRSRGL